MDNTCVCCGEPVPEGRRVCLRCDGGHKVHNYTTVEELRNVTIRIMKCKVCGHTYIGWSRQDNTEAVYGK